MKTAVRYLAIGLGAFAVAAPASAADWWLISGVPSDPTAILADVSTLSRTNQSAEMKVLGIDRLGRSFETEQQIQCDQPSTSTEEENDRRLACSAEKDRDQHGLILAAMNPMVVARMIFSPDSSEAAAEAAEKAAPRT